ncbi:transposase-like protein, ISSpn1 ISSpn3 [Streptococcus pneumoniae]|nr:transposase-like protein, ISSpn1 ISSpn3 [Streptococcus pneumoniae]
MTEFSLDLLLKAIKLARWTYYYHLKQLDKPDKDQELKAEIQSIFIEHKGNYGYRRIYLELRNRGYLVNHKRVQGLMKVLNLQAKMRQKRKYSSHKGDVGKKAENLIQGQFEGSKTMEKCYTDVTYLRAENAILKKLRELRLKEEKEKEERQKLFKN